MYIPNWLRSFRPHTIRRRSTHTTRYIRLQLEGLEERITPTGPITIQAPNADQLQKAITTANNNPTQQYVIQLTGSSPYDLTAVQDIINTAGVTITGSSTVLNAAANQRVFRFETNANLTLQNLTVEGGKVTVTNDQLFGGGGILDLGGKLALTNVVVQGNSVQAAARSNAQGGGIYVSGGTLSIKNSTIRGNSATGGVGATGTENSPTGGNGGSGQGGGVYSINSIISIEGSSLTDNIAHGGDGGHGFSGNVSHPIGGNGGNGSSGQGGGVYSTNSTITIVSSSFTDNTAQGGRGGTGGTGGNGGRVGTGGTGGTGGLSGDGAGGAMYFATKATVNIKGTNLQHNQAIAGTGGTGGKGGVGGIGGLGGGGGMGGNGNSAYGGAIFVDPTTPYTMTTPYTITNSSLILNSAMGGNGGTGGAGGEGGDGIIGINSQSGSGGHGGHGGQGGNGGDGDGGGAYIGSAGDPNNTFSQNSATGGGSGAGGLGGPGGANGNGSGTGGTGSAGGSGAQGNGNGGGEFISSGGSLLNGTFNLNTASSSGGGIYVKPNHSGPILINTILENNQAGNGPNVFGAVDPSSANNFVSSTTGATGFDPTNNNILNNSTNQLGSLTTASNGTSYYPLLPFTASINGGTNSFTTSDGKTHSILLSIAIAEGFTEESQATDQIGNPRITDPTDNIDIGATEFQGLPTTTLASNVSTIFSPNAQNVTLTATVTSSYGAVNEGSVTFTIMQGSTVIGTATASTVTNGIASVSYVLPAGTAVGSYTIVASYHDTLGNFADSSDNTHTLTVKPLPSAISVQIVSVPYTTFDPQPLTNTTTLTANLTNSKGIPFNEGQVQFVVTDSSGAQVGGTVIGDVHNGQANATFIVPPQTALGNYTITAHYSDNSPNGLFANSSGTGTLTVVASPTTVNITNVSVFYTLTGEIDTITAYVVGNPQTVGQGFQVNGGFVTFSDNGQTMTVPVVNSVATATFNIPFSAENPFTHSISAAYGPSGNNYLASSSIYTINQMQIFMNYLLQLLILEFIMNNQSGQ